MPDPRITLHPPTPSTLPALKRLNALLLPINYPESFYAEILASPTTTRLTRLAFWGRETGAGAASEDGVESAGRLGGLGFGGGAGGGGGGGGLCVGGVRCRFETPPTPPTLTPPPPLPPGETEEEEQGEGEGGDVKRSNGSCSLGGGGSPGGSGAGGAIYIMTLCTLSPYRHLGVGTQLIASVLAAAAEMGCVEVYAHVWEANTDALDWYRKRGFDVDSGEVVQGYYRKLRPAGARVVRRRVGVGDALAAAAASRG